MSAPTTDQARELVAQARALRERWIQRHADTSAELEHLEANLGALMLEDPEQEDELIARITRLRGRVAAAEQAVHAQEPNVLAAERAFLAVEAKRCRMKAAAAAVQREEHRAKVNALLGQLEALDGATYMATDQVAHMLVSAGLRCDLVWRPSKVKALDKVVADATHRAEALEALADGRSLEPLLLSWGVATRDVLPATVYGPDAVVRAPQWLDAVSRSDQTLEELEALAQRLPAEIAEWKAKEKAEQWRASEFGGGAVHLIGLSRRQARAETIAADLEQARAAAATTAR